MTGKPDLLNPYELAKVVEALCSAAMALKRTTEAQEERIKLLEEDVLDHYKNFVKISNHLKAAASGIESLQSTVDYHEACAKSYRELCQRILATTEVEVSREDAVGTCKLVNEDYVRSARELANALVGQDNEGKC